MRSFLSAFSTSVYLSSVVVQELLAGARRGELRRLERGFIEPFEQLGRVVTPSHTSWTRAGMVLQMLRGGGYTITASFTNDVLVAVSAVQIGARVIHDNQKDYAAIARHLPPLSHTATWPIQDPF